VSSSTISNALEHGKTYPSEIILLGLPFVMLQQGSRSGSYT